MTFREKTDWATLFAIIVGFGWYFMNVTAAYEAAGSQLDGKAGLFASLALLLLATIIVTVLIIVPLVIAAIRNPADADAPVDERERSFELRSMRTGFYLVHIGIVCVFVAAWMGYGLFILLNLLLAIVVLSEVVRLSHGLWLYRRG